MASKIITKSKPNPLSFKPVRRKPLALSADELARRQAFMDSFLASTKETQGIAEASKMIGGDTIVLPMMVFGVRKTENGRMITGMVAPLTYFKKQGVKGYNYNADKKRNEIEVIQDIRSGDKRTADKKADVDFETYDIHDMTEIEGAVDTKETMCRARRVISEGDILTAYFGQSEEQESNIGPGYLVVVNYSISCYHKAIKNEESVVIRKEISLFEQIESVRSGISIPVGIVADWLQQMNLVTQQFRTRVGDLMHYAENTPGVSEEKVKRMSYRMPNYCMIPLGWPADETHPNIGRSDANILVNTTPAKETNFLREDKKAKVPKGQSQPNLPHIQMSMKGYQWRGAHESSNYDPEDVVFALDMSIYDRSLNLFKIKSPQAWGALMPPLFELLEGVIVAKENLNVGMRVEGNASRVAELGVGASAKEMSEKLNGPVGENKPSFILKLNAEALLIDPVRFVQRVGFRVTPARLIEYWNGKKMARKEDYVTVNQKIDFGSPLMCLTESPNQSLDMIFMQPDNYEFRMITNVIPTSETLANTRKQDLYDELADMSPEYGDQFFDFIVKGLGNGKTRQQYAKTAGSKLAKDHPCRKYNFQLFGEQSPIVYVFAINMLHLASQYKSAEEQLSSNGLVKLITGGSNEEAAEEEKEEASDTAAKADPDNGTTAAAAKDSKKRSIDDVSNADKGTPSKRSRRNTRAQTAAAAVAESNPDEIDIDQDPDQEASEASSADSSSADSSSAEERST